MLLGCLAGRPAAAEIVVLAGGGMLKVTSFAVEDSRMRLGLPAGGWLTVPLLAVERVVADEIVPALGPLPEASFSLRFEPGQGAPPTPYGDLIFGVARRYELNPELVVAMVRVESAFDPSAVSSKGARGLLQLMPATARRFGVGEGLLFDPEMNLEAGARYLRWLVDRFEGDLRLILAAYNAGEGVVERHGGVPPYRETENYIRSVYSALGLAVSAPASSR